LTLSEKVQLELLNRKRGLSEELAVMEEEIKAWLRYQQGCRCRYRSNIVDNLDATHTLIQKVIIPRGVIAINSVKLSAYGEKFKAYETGTPESGGSTVPSGSTAPPSVTTSGPSIEETFAEYLPQQNTQGPSPSSSGSEDAHLHHIYARVYATVHFSCGFDDLNDWDEGAGGSSGGGGSVSVASNIVSIAVYAPSGGTYCKYISSKNTYGWDSLNVEYRITLHSLPTPGSGKYLEFWLFLSPTKTTTADPFTLADYFAIGIRRNSDGSLSRYVMRDGSVLWSDTNNNSPTSDVPDWMTMKLIRSTGNMYCYFCVARSPLYYAALNLGGAPYIYLIAKTDDTVSRTVQAKKALKWQVDSEDAQPAYSMRWSFAESRLLTKFWSDTPIPTKTDDPKSSHKHTLSHTHPIPGQSHSHGMDHTHIVPGSSHLHSVTLSDHVHDLTYAIYEAASATAAVNLTITDPAGNNHNVGNIGTGLFTNEDLELKEYFTMIGVYTFIFSADALARITSIVVCDLVIEPE